jgi:membrane protein
VALPRGQTLGSEGIVLGEKRDKIIARLKQFVSRGIWQADTQAFPWLHRLLMRVARLVLLTVEALDREKISLRAYALTYISLLALVPVLAIVAAVFKGMGGMNILEEHLNSLVLENIVPQAQTSISDFIMDMVGNVNFGSLGVLGVLGTIFTVLAAVKRIEDSFNEIMYARRTRSAFSRFSTYWSILTLGPLLLFGSLSLQTVVLKNVYVQKVLEISILNSAMVKAMPIVMTCLLFWALYQFIPNTRVNPISAMIGGICMGLVWEAAKATYYVSLAGSFRFNTIYGTLAVLPVTLLWLYLTWTIVLLGAVMTYTHQHLDSLLQTKTLPRLSHQATETLACRALLLVSRRFHAGKEPLSSREIAGELSVPPQLLDPILAELERGGFLVEMAGEEGAFQPARSLDMVRLEAVVAYLRTNGDALPVADGENENPIDPLLAAGEEALLERVSGKTMLDLVVKYSRAT